LESFITGKIMLYLDPTTTNIILTAAVIGIFVIFLFLLVKLNPSADTKRKTEDESKHEKPKQEQPRTLSPQSPTVPSEETIPQTPPERPAILVSPANTGTSVQTRQEPRAMPLIPDQQRRASSTTQKTVAPPPSKPAPLPPYPTKKDCAHHFGYLRTFPKNSPIPDECFGCEKIVDCLVNNKKSR
jgi:hypothetical protein